MTTDTSSECFALMAAVPSEGDLLLSELRYAQTTTYGDLEIRRGMLADKTVVIAFSGLGKINAAAAAATMLTVFQVSRLWMWGSAGAYPNSDVRLNDVALASEEVLADEGVVTLSSWKPLEAIGIPLAKHDDQPVFNQMPVGQVDLRRARLLLNKWHAASLGVPIHVGPFITLSGVSGSSARARLLADRFGALCENMEGGAAAQVCLRHRVPFLEIRGLSNWAGDRNKRRWHLTTALDNCQRAMLYLLEHWNKVSE